jgi:hypothetical protein
LGQFKVMLPSELAVADSCTTCVFATWADALNFGIIKADRNRKRWVMCFIDFKYKN